MYPKPFLCPSGHILGEVYRVNNIRRLTLYRQADQPEDVITVLTGPADEITCSICGRKRNWWIGDEAFQELLEAWGITHNNQQ